MTRRRLLLLAQGASLSGHAPLPRAQAAAAGLRRVGVPAPSTQAKEDITLNGQQEKSLGKALHLLHELMPTARRIAVVVTEANPSQQALWAAARHAAAVLNLQPLQVAVNAPAQLPAAAQQITMLQAPAVLLTAVPVFTNVRERIQPLMHATRLPVAYSLRHRVAADGRTSFGNPLRANRHYPAKFVDAIRKSAKPANLPVEQPLKFERVVNLSATRKLGLTVQRALLLRADKVLQ